MPGPKPKPTSLKLLQGNPGHRALPKSEPQPRPVAPDCPDYLGTVGRIRWAVDRDGALTTNATTGMVHVHPCCKIEREARQAFSRLWLGMHLEWHMGEDRHSA